MTKNEFIWITDILSQTYKHGYTVSDMISTIKMKYKDRLIAIGLGENALWDICLAWVLKNDIDFDQDNIR